VYLQPWNLARCEVILWRFWRREDCKFVLNRNRCLMESGFGKRGKALVRLATGFYLQTLAGVGSAHRSRDAAVAEKGGYVTNAAMNF
jgi:hypothetical protein